MCDHRADGQLALFEQVDLIAAEIGGADAVEATPRVAVEGLDDLEIALAGRRGVMAPHELVVQTLQQIGHRQPPVTRPMPLRITPLPVGRRASGFVLVA